MEERQALEIYNSIRLSGNPFFAVGEKGGKRMWSFASAAHHFQGRKVKLTVGGREGGVKRRLAHFIGHSPCIKKSSKITYRHMFAVRGQSVKESAFDLEGT
jgi:hypothetical protein